MVLGVARRSCPTHPIDWAQASRSLAVKQSCNRRGSIGRRRLQTNRRVPKPESRAGIETRNRVEARQGRLDRHTRPGIGQRQRHQLHVLVTLAGAGHGPRVIEAQTVVFLQTMPPGCKIALVQRRFLVFEVSGHNQEMMVDNIELVQ